MSFPGTGEWCRRQRRREIFEDLRCFSIDFLNKINVFDMGGLLFFGSENIFGESIHSRGENYLKQLGRGLPISPDVVVEAVSRSVCELTPPHVIE